MGYADAMRFLLQYDSGTGDYTRERDEILPDIPTDELVRREDAITRQIRGTYESNDPTDG